IPGANSQSYHPTQNGNYSVVITDVNNCTASSSDYPFVITGMSAPDGADEVLIYPNPATNKIIVQSLKFKIEGVEVYDVVGRLTLNPSPEGEGFRVEVDVSLLNEGIYFVKVKGEMGIVVLKFVKL
ncbi:MAG: T9SS type A sorting domain-containing protein, partial [Bacteroidia bacterium]|nr:T9SS type A sorting domain-containing protein [Bacteroidia bacterium]